MIWQFLDSLIRKTTSIAVPILQDQLSLNDSIPASLTQSEADTIILLITITNHKIWKARNTKIYQNTKINARSIVIQIKKAILRRHRLESQKIVQPYLPILQRQGKSIKYHVIP